MPKTIKIELILVSCSHLQETSLKNSYPCCNNAAENPQCMPVMVTHICKSIP